jgi:hypothetical protein
MSTIDLTTTYRQSAVVHVGKKWAIHHTVSPNQPRTSSEELSHLEAINTFHRARGFAVGIGYHVVVFDSGRAYRVGEQGTQRAHIAELNHKYDGLAFVGTFTADLTPSGIALETARRVIAESGMPVAGGHRDLATSGSPTACPGGWDVAALLDPANAPRPLSPPLSTMTLARLCGATFLPARNRGVSIERLPLEHGEQGAWEVRML